MKKSSFVIVLIICFYASACTRDKDTWVAFYNKDTTLVGFKDEKGEVKIAPKFTTYGVARKFDDIIAVSEFKKTKSINYYLTKKGRIVGRDSLYYFDNTADCECEGFIRFKDHKSLKMGMFNANGDIAIPATYNYLSPVRNGLIMAVKDAKRVYPKDGDEEHFNPWQGGNEVLIDINNKVLIANFPYRDELDFYSVVISEKPDPSAIRKNFKANDGMYYSFISFEKEFSLWLQKSFLNDLSVRNILDKSFEEIETYLNTDELKQPDEEFVRGNLPLLKSKLLQFRTGGSDWFISNGQLDIYSHSSKKYEKYFDNCSMYKSWIYPVMEIITTFKSDNIPQDQFAFLRTSDGYKLISATMNQSR